MNIKIIKILLEYGADINAKDNRGFTALIGAGKTDFVRALLENNADTEIKNNDKENTALLYACKSINKSHSIYFNTKSIKNKEISKSLF